MVGGSRPANVIGKDERTIWASERVRGTEEAG